MKSFIQIRGRRRPRVIRHTQLRTERAGVARMDATATHGPSQIELGDVKLLDARTTHAMQIALDACFRDVCKRFNLDFAIVHRPQLAGRFPGRDVGQVKHPHGAVDATSAAPHPLFSSSKIIHTTGEFP